MRTTTPLASSAPWITLATAVEGQEVLSTHRDERDVPHDDRFVARILEESVPDDVLQARMVALCKVTKGVDGTDQSSLPQLLAWHPQPLE